MSDMGGRKHRLGSLSFMPFYFNKWLVTLSPLQMGGLIYTLSDNLSSAMQ